MSKRKAYVYKGVLNQPMSVHLFLGVALAPNDPEFRAAASEDHSRQYLERVHALYEDCGADPSKEDAWLKIALTLAQRHVPGFWSAETKRRKVGRPRLENNSYTFVTSAPRSAFVAAVDRGRADAKEKGLTKGVAVICAALARKGELPLRYRGRKPSTLARLYFEARVQLDKERQGIETMRQFLEGRSLPVYDTNRKTLVGGTS